MSEEELIDYFWKLTEKIVDPLVELSKLTHHLLLKEVSF